MKITVFGLTISSSWGNGHATPYRAILRALHRMGHEIHFFEKDVPYYRARRDFDTSDYCRLTFYEDWRQIRRQALAHAAESDVVITASYLPEGARINNDVLELGRPLRVFYDLDTPVTVTKMEYGGVDYVLPAQLSGFDLVLSFTGGKILAELEQRYGVRMARALYGCVDPDDYRRVEPAAEFACDLSYMGTYAADRQHKVNMLFLEPARRHPEKQFVLAGSLYPWEWRWPENVRRIEHAAPHEHPQFYSSSRITLNITRDEMARWGWCPSGRFFEAAACGTPIISDWWEGLDWFFDVARDIRVVSRPEHVEQALSMPDSDLEALARHARERTLEDHTGQVRARQLLQYLEEARAAAPNEKREVMQ
ncbi:MAG TPA: glycosyltransferase [Candidatus Limnocylindrales bacterium]|nr:glycosyltransferase [Candidatus Limnocylindrales bacterium]